MHFGRAQFFAVNRAEPSGEILLQRFRPVGRDQASRVQRTAESIWCPATAKWFKIGERNGSVTGHFLPGIKDRLGAIESFGRLSENFQRLLFHKRNEPQVA